MEPSCYEVIEPLHHNHILVFLTDDERHNYHIYHFGKMLKNRAINLCKVTANDNFIDYP